MSSEPKLRPGRPADAEPMSVLHHRCWLVAFVDLVEPTSAVAEMQPMRNRERFGRWLAPGSDVFVTVAEVDGAVAGYSAVHGHELLHLFVEPAHHGAGLGKRLLAAGEQLLADQGQRMIELHTQLGNDPAIGLYRSAGWLMTEGIVHNDHDGVAYDEHIMVKRLAGQTDR